ncbi:MAG: hypothetical protein ACM3MK_08030 [Chitinophagales bacterium]
MLQGDAKKRINPRIILWIIVAGTILAMFLLKNQPEEPKLEPVSNPVVSRETVISDFRDLKDIDVPVKPSLGGSFITTKIWFPQGFKGRYEDEFYVRLEDGHNQSVVKYRLDKPSAEVSSSNQYSPLGTEDARFNPPANCDTWSLEPSTLSTK